MPKRPKTTRKNEVPLQHRIEFRPLAELELLDDVARQIARQHELHLARHRLLIDGRVALQALFRFGPQENVFAGLDQHPRFGLVPRRDQIDGDEGDAGGRKREPDDPAFLAPQRLAEHAEIKFINRLCDAKATRQWQTDLHNPLHNNAHCARLSNPITKD